MSAPQRGTSPIGKPNGQTGPAASILGQSKAPQRALTADERDELQRLRDQVSRLEAEKTKSVKVRVNALGVETGSKDDDGNPVLGKGTISVVGLGRFPVTLYASQWRRLGGVMADILATIDQDESKAPEDRQLAWK